MLPSRGVFGELTALPDVTANTKTGPGVAPEWGHGGDALRTRSDHVAYHDEGGAGEASVAVLFLLRLLHLQLLFPCRADLCG